MNFRLSSRAVFLIIWDIVVVYAALVIATLGTNQEEEIFKTTDWIFLFGIVALVSVAVLVAFRLYNNLWEYASASEALQIVYATVIAMAVSAALHFVAGERLPLRVYITAWFIMLVLVGLSRFFFRYWKASRQNLSRHPIELSRPRTLVVGAGETGSLTIKRMVDGDYAMQGNPVAAVDDDPAKRGMRIHKIKVVGGTDMILDLVATYNIEQIVVAIPSATLEQRKNIYDICIQTDCKLLTLPNVRDLRMDELDDVRLREVDLTDLLSREEVKLNEHLVAGYLSGKRILITGGGGSIGSELARQIATVLPAQIIAFDIYENTAYELELEMRDKHPGLDFKVEVGSIRDNERLNALFETYKPEVVFHAAAHKHVPLMEANPREAVLNNVFGTLATVQAAHEHGATSFVFISTDKAVNPTSVMGATKRLGEMIVQHYAKISKTCFSAVRFGNVLGSHGSVVPMFKRQIEEGGPITVTDPEVTRYFMTIPEASRLVLQAGSLARCGVIFILEMGDQIKIVDLARKIVRLSGLRPDIDIKIKFVGLRPGEKLYEELMMDEETPLPTSVDGVMMSSSTPCTSQTLLQDLETLRTCLESENSDIIAYLKKQVPTYKPEEDQALYGES